MTDRSKSLLLAFVSVGVCGVGLECALRVAVGPPITWMYPQESYLADAEMGHSLEPNQHAFTMNTPVEINELGIREGEMEPNRTRPSLRILAMGDSQTFGVGLRSEDTWPKQLERVLARDASGCRVEVVNAGLPASATWNQEVLARRLLPIYRPDLVVVGFYVNDVMKATGQPPFSTRRKSSLALRAVYLAKRSAVVTAVWQAWLSLREITRSSEDFVHEKSVVEDSHPWETAPGWSQVQSSLEHMKGDAGRAGAGLVVMAMPRVDEVDGRIAGGRWQSRLLAITRPLEVPLVDMLPVLREAHARGDLLTIPWDGHFSAAAQAAMANALARALVNEMPEMMRSRCARE